MIRHIIQVSILAILLLSFGPSPTLAQPTVPLTVTIFRLIEIDNPDGDPLSFHGDFYSKVRINGFEFQQSSEVSFDPDFGEGIIFTLPLVFEPFWTFSRNVDTALETVIIEIQLFDSDTFSDDRIDINPTPGVKDLTLSLDLSTGNWSGDVPLNQTFSQGDGDDDRAKIFFDISLLSASGDADGDGLLDGWESRGLDDDGDGSLDVDLPAFGADPNHKDIFLELDWMSGNAPTRAGIQAMKAAFDSAPINAGTNGSSLPRGADANSNPDGQPGINLWVDTGTLADPTASEDGLGAGSCGDGIDNGGDGSADGSDSDCLVGDNFGGGNQIVATAIPYLDSSFYTVKDQNFDANRQLIFRYGLSAAPGFEDSSTAGNSCTDGIDNGGGDEDGDGDPEIDDDDPDCWPWGGGWGELGGNDFIEYNHDGGTIMHELGHTLNLQHGGNIDNNCKPNYISVMNYDHQSGIPRVGGGAILDFSPPRSATGRGAVPLPQLVENNLNESIILDNSDATNRFIFVQYQPNGSEDGVATGTCSDNNDNNGNGLIDAADPACGFKVQQNLNGTDINGDGTIDGVDWNGDGIPGGSGLTVNLNTSGNRNVFDFASPPAAPIQPDFVPAGCTDPSIGTLNGFNDWLNISIPFRQFGKSASSAINPTTEPEPTLQELLQLKEQLNTTDLEISKSDSPSALAASQKPLDSPYPYTVYLPIIGELTSDPRPPALDPTAPVATSAIAGTELVYTLDVTNNGPNPASQVKVVDILPSGVTYISDDAGCTEAPTGTLTCDLGEILAGATRQILITVMIAADLVYNAGGPTTITNNASTENQVGPDLDASNNDASVDTEVFAAADLEITDFIAVNLPAQILVAEPVDITLQKTIINNGPSGPMDVALTNTATAPADASVDPNSSDTVELALGLNEQRQVEDDYTIQCDGFSHHNFTFTTAIQPVSMEDSDPDLSNNEAELTVDLECVVPVAIDVIPSQINLKGQGVIPVLVLDSEAGEYGLPLAFDASTIDPLNVHFGARDDIWAETGGATEAHDQGHGHGQGLLFHFIAAETGLTVNDTEACLKGAWFDDQGNPHSFFGCDEVTVK